jgi:Holliday junction resolvase RusA-like endonuclease
MREVTFIIDSEPCGKGRPRFTKSGHCYTPAKTADYERLVVDSYRAAGHARDLPHAGIVGAQIRAVYGMPEKRDWSVHYVGAPCTKMPDGDNIAKIILDSLNKAAYLDDSQVTALSVSKEWGEEGFVSVTLNFFD